MTSQPETKVTNWTACKDGPWYPGLSHGGYVSYRIWQQFTGREWFQRHEWTRADGSTEMEDWIPGCRSWTAGALPVDLAA